MKKAIIDLNCKDKEYKFSLSVITEKDWIDLAHAIVLNKGQNIKILTINGFKIVIRDNKAKVKIFYQDSYYHELEYHLDEFGRVSQSYEDEFSQLLQDVMSKHYGQEYNLALTSKLKSFEETV